MGAVLVLYGSWQLVRWGPADRTMIADAFFYLVAGVAVCTAYSASRRCDASPRLARAWRLFAMGLFGQLTGQVAFQVYDLLGKTPYPSVADGFYLLFYPFMLLGLLSLSVSSRRGAGDVRLGIDLAVVAIAGSALVIYVVLGPTVVANSGSPLQVGFSVAYPAGDMILLVGLASLLLRGSTPSAHAALRLLGAGLVLFVIGDLAYGYMTVHSSYESGDPIDATWMVALALMAIAGTTQRAAEGSESSERLHTRVSWVPPVAVAFGFGLLVFSDRHVTLFPGLVMIAIAIMLAGLVLARQVLVQRDLVQAQEELRHQAFHDGLTGLPNRVLVLDRAEQMLARARREQRDVPALFIDIDGFKHVNDSLGHGVGDRLLQTVAARLRAVVRESDTVGRFGGDEFVVLLDPGTLDVAPEVVAERMLMAARDPIELDGSYDDALTISLSIGITVGPHETADALLRDADIALYRAKESGKDAYAVFDSMAATVDSRTPLLEAGRAQPIARVQMLPVRGGTETVSDQPTIGHAHRSPGANSRHELALATELAQAIGGNEIELYFQPQADADTGRIVAVEALVRWRHPGLGLLQPSEFLRLAETAELVRLTNHVLDAALAQCAAWRADGLELRVSINVSGGDLLDSDLPRRVAAALTRNGLSASSLTIELTESAVPTNPLQHPPSPHRPRRTRCRPLTRRLRYRILVLRPPHLPAGRRDQDRQNVCVPDGFEPCRAGDRRDDDLARSHAREADRRRGC